MSTHVTLEPPRAGTPGRSRRTPTRKGPGQVTRGNFELYSWLFMRASGVLLVFLVLGHLFIMMVTDGGVEKIGFAFVAGRWASPWWQFWDLLQLWLAMLHGTNGMRTVVNDYADTDRTRAILKGLLYTAAVLTVFLGTLVIFTFDPNIKG